MSVVLVLLVAGVVLAAGGVAYAYKEPLPTPGAVGDCAYCHRSEWNPVTSTMRTITRLPEGGDCDACHGPYIHDRFTGPHGGYSATTKKCEACHDVHDASDGGTQLLPAPTVVGTCYTCHDGSGGFGVYGTLAARGVAVQGGHRVEATSTVPGGDPVSGGSSTGSFRGPGGKLICTDCHSVHASRVVAAFKGERRRVRARNVTKATSKLLRRQPTGAASEVAKYGSDWCAGCHKGRMSGGSVHNHPVDSLAIRPDAFDFSRVAVLTTDAPTAATTFGPLGGVPGASWSHTSEEATGTGNRGFLMPYPRTPQQGTHFPICQQCHEDSRIVGTLSADGATADAVESTITAADGLEWSSATSTWTASMGNPRFQNFPHETSNPRMLVETEDDLCTNCHAPAQLP